MKRKIEAMHAVYGVTKGDICKNCCNLLQYSYHNKPYRKCKAYGLSHSEATDWVIRWTACGLFGRDFQEMPERPLHKRINSFYGTLHEDEQIVGQLKL